MTIYFFWFMQLKTLYMGICMNLSGYRDLVILSDREKSIEKSVIVISFNIILVLIFIYEIFCYLFINKLIINKSTRTYNIT
jgi:hypothetical protein